MTWHDPHDDLPWEETEAYKAAMNGAEGGFTEDGRDGLKPGEFSPVMRCAHDIEPETVNYLWYPFFALGKLSILGGDGGTGKSYLTAAVATAHSLGTWPFFINGKASIREPGHTLIFSAEDGVEDTYLPRLINLGADLRYIHFVDGKKDWRGVLHRVVLNDRDIITRCIRQYDAKVAIFDPLQSFLPRGTKMNDMETVRPVLDALILAAKQTVCHLLLSGHLSKARQDTASYKFLGSVDWYNAARSAMLILKNPDNPETERLFYHVKNSLGPTAPGIRFSIAETNEPIFLWGKTAEATVEEVMAGNGKRNIKEQAALEFLQEELKDGDVAVEDIKASAKSLRIAWRTVERAKAKLKIRSQKGAGEFAGRWYWQLPNSAK